MKKRAVFLSALCATLLLFTISASAAPISELADKQSNINDKKIVRAVVDEDPSHMQPLTKFYERKEHYNDTKNLDIKSQGDISYGDPFKVYHFISLILDEENRAYTEEICKDFLAGEKLYKVLSKAPYFWEVPVLLKDGESFKPASSIDVGSPTEHSYMGGKMIIQKLPGFLSADKAYLCSQPNKVAELLKEKGITDADRFMNIKLTDYYQFLYVQKDSEEYFVPLTDGFDTKASTLYKRDEFQSKIAPTLQYILDHNPLTDSNIATGGIGSPKTANNKPNNTNNAIPVTLAILILGALGTAGVAYKRHR